MKTIYVDLWTQSNNFYGNDLTLLIKFPSCATLRRTVLQDVVGVKLCHFSNAWFRCVSAFVQHCDSRLIFGRFRLRNGTGTLATFAAVPRGLSHSVQAHSRQHLNENTTASFKPLFSSSFRPLFRMGSFGSVLRWATIWNLPFSLQQLTNLTQRSGVIREKLIVPQLVKKLSALYRARRFINVCTTVSHCPYLAQINYSHTNPPLFFKIQYYPPI